MSDGVRTFMDDVEKRKILPLSGLEFRSFGRPVNSQSLYRLSYPGGQVAVMLYADFLLGLFLEPEDESGMFSRNVGCLRLDYTVLYAQDRTVCNLTHLFT
jgi:hypothetical protein